jgi:hypothetical protein
LLACFTAILTYAQTPVITHVVDGCGSDAKFVEIYVSGTLDLADYKLVRRSNSGTWEENGADIDLTALGSRTDEFVYVGRDIATLTAEFPAADISASNAIEDGGVSHNGNDSYRLVQIDGDVVIDQFGADINGSGEPWEYEDAWGSRKFGVQPNPVFTLSEWTFGAINSLDSAGLCNGEAVLEDTIEGVGNYSPGPTTVPAAPTEDQADVVSVYGDELAGSTSFTATTFDEPGNNSTGEFQNYASNEVFQVTYEGDNFIGLQFDEPIDASAMEFFHLDVWVANPLPIGAVFILKWVNHAGGHLTGETSSFTATRPLAPDQGGQWLSIDIPLTSEGFPNVSGDGLDARSILSELVINTASSQGTFGPLLFDNLYFWKEPSPASDCGTTGSYTYVNNSDLDSSLNGFVADNPGDFVTLTFSAGSTESCCDDWFINDAADGSGNTIATGSGSIVGSYESTTGEISFYVESDFSAVGTTFEYSVSCAAPPACPEPTDLAVSNVTADSAQVIWNGLIEASSGYEYFLSSDGTVPDASTPPTGDTTDEQVMLSDLSPETQYEVYVRSVCDADASEFSDWTDGVSFETGIASVIVSPGTSESDDYCYDNSEFKEWLFESSDGSPLLIEFLQGSVEVRGSGGTWDDLTIYDGQDDTGEVLYDSDLDNVTAADLTGLELLANSGFIYMTLDSDSSVSCADPGSGAPQTEIQFEVSIPEILDFYNLQFPASQDIANGDSFSVFARAFEAGLTDASNSPAAGIEAWIGYSSTDSNPNTDADWTWVPATPNPGWDFSGNDDEYTLDLGAEISTAGTYYYASRWSLNNGPFTYGGILPDGTNGGEWGVGEFASGVLTVTGSSGFANVQVIHNSPDPAAEFVDVYINDELALDDFEFRTSTSFLELPAGAPVSIDIAGASSGVLGDALDPANSLYNLTTTLDADENYILVANGVLNADDFNTDNEFEISVYAGANTVADDPTLVDVLVHHGSPDAPAVDVNETDAGNLVSNISYPEFQGYLPLAGDDYVLEITGAGSTNLVASFEASLGGFEGAAITVLASGFLTDDAGENNGFGLWVASAAGGPLLELPVVIAPPTGDCGTFGDFTYVNNSDLDNSLNGFVADNPGDFITLTFSAGSTESGFDFWFINDAADGTGNTIASGDGSIVGSYESTTGEISFYVESDGGVLGSTFEYAVSCAAPPACPTPINLAVSGITSDSADLAWDAVTEAADGYEYFLSSDGTAPDNSTPATGSVSAGETSLMLEGLDADTAYTVYVRSVCDSASSEVSEWSESASFFTGYCIPVQTGTSTATWINDFSTSGGVVNISNLESGRATDGYEDNFETGVVQSFDGGSFDVSFAETGGSVGAAIWIDWNNDLVFDPETERVFNTTGFSFGPFDTTIVVPEGTPMGDYRMRAMVDWSDGNIEDGACDFIRGEVEDYKITIGMPPACIANAGTITADSSSYLLDGNTTISATPDGNVVVPTDYEVTYVLTSGEDLVIQQAGSVPSFDVAVGGDYTIHTLVAETSDETSPDYLNLGVIEFGVTTGGDVIGIITDNDLCASLDAVGAPITVIDPQSLDELLIVDLSVSNQVTITSTDGASFSTVSGSDGTGFLLADFYSNAGPEGVFVTGSGDLTSATETSDGTPGIFRGDGDPGLNVWTYTDDPTSNFTAGELAFTGVGTWTLSEAQYNAMLTAPASGLIYFPADSSDDIDAASLLGTYGVTLPPLSANVQIIHNSADPAASLVDIYVNGNLAFEDVAFRTATPFVQLPAETPIDIDIAPAGSTDVSESVFNLNTALAADESYIVVADGVLDPSQFDASVNSDIAFNLEVYANAQQTSTNAGETSLLIHHGATDAPSVDVVETSVPAGTLADDISYPEFQGYVDVPTSNYVLNVELADNSAVVETYQANLADLGTQDLAITVLASGFLDPSANQGGEAFGLWAAVPAGGALIPLPPVTVGTTQFDNNNFSFYPNPARNEIKLETRSQVEEVRIFNMLGQQVMVKSPQTVSPRLNVESLQTGTYIMNVTIDGASKNFKFIKE